MIAGFGVHSRTSAYGGGANEPTENAYPSSHSFFLGQTAKLNCTRLKINGMIVGLVVTVSRTSACGREVNEPAEIASLSSHCLFGSDCRSAPDFN